MDVQSKNPMVDFERGLHVRFGNLPRVDRNSGTVINSEHFTPASPILKHRSAMKNASTTGHQTQYAVDGRTIDSTAAYHDLHSQTSTTTVVFREIKWSDDPHPGHRIPFDVNDCESVSPKATVVKIPAWSLEAEEKWFRGNVQPRRFTGRRRPGMVRKSKPPETQEDGCHVQ